MKLYRALILLTVVLSISGLAIAQHSHLAMMRQAGASFLGLRDDLGAKNMDAAKLKARDLVQVTKEIEAFWTLRNMDYEVDDGLKAARETHRAALKVSEALEAGNAEAASAALQTTVTGCGGCHQKYRPAQRPE